MPALTNPGDLPTKEGYTFEGYFDVSNGENQYYNSDGTSAKQWDKTDATFTLYAH